MINEQCDEDYNKFILISLKKYNFQCFVLINKNFNYYIVTFVYT